MFRIFLPALFFISTAIADVDVTDPIEPVNRGVFWFNDQVDSYLLGPVARSYDYITPNVVQHSVENFFDNARSLRYFVSDVVQFKFDQAARHTARFLINTTVGLFGIFDVAEEIGIPKHEEDFGIALAYHGVGPGPYLVLPFLGPSNLRDAVGRVVDAFLDPFTLFGIFGDSDYPTTLSVGPRLLDLIQTRANLEEGIKTAKESSVDYYLFVQGAYYQYRLGILHDGDVPEE